MRAGKNYGKATPIQIALTDDHALFRKSMKDLVEKLGNY